MIEELRARFNREFTPARYASFTQGLERRLGVPIEFRLSETPCFVPAALVTRLIDAANDLVSQLLDNPGYLSAADAVVPDGCRPAHGENRPSFIQVDFGFVNGPNGPESVEARLVELQAFPSLYGFQLFMAEASRDLYGFPETSISPGGLTREEYLRLVGHAILGGHHPDEVVLLEIEPHRQKTRPDFAATEQLWGVRAVDLSEVEQHGRRLFWRRHGRVTPIARIYNRVIPDELVRTGRSWPFDLAADLDVEWAGGPDWFFRVSKFSIPWLRHPWVPRTQYLADVERMPEPREDWLLKPLYSFAGGGIIFGPTDADLAAIPPASRGDYILQERVAFVPVIDTPFGPTQVEVRLMMVRDGDGYRTVMPLGRMGRGRMMGVDHNRGLEWVGATAVLIG